MINALTNKEWILLEELHNTWQWSVDYPNVAQPNDRLSERVQEWMDIDDEDPRYQIMQDSEILDLMTNKADTTSIANSDNDDENIVLLKRLFA